MLAYVFWHRPRTGVDHDAYRDAQRAFHRSLAMRSACFWLAELPFADGGGYEDWYLVEGWGALGDLNARAVNERHRPSHDGAASLAGEGWGGVYALVRGEAKVPAGVQWLDRPRDVTSAEFIAALPGDDVWRRQLVLGPAPEFCVASAGPSSGRRAVWPDRAVR